MESAQLRRDIQKYRNRESRRVHVRSMVIFNGGLYNKGVIENIERDKVRIKVPNGRHFQSDGEIPGYTRLKHKDEIIVRNFSMEEYNGQEVKYLFTNKFRDEEIGNVEIKWSNTLKDKLMTLVDGEVICAFDPAGDGTVARFLRHVDGENEWLIPATSLCAIPAKKFEDWDIGINRSFQITDNKDEIVYPIGRKIQVRPEQIRAALNATVETRKKSAVTQLEDANRQVMALTDQLAGQQLRKKSITEEMDMLGKVGVDDEKVARAARIINDTWDDFRFELSANGAKVTFAGPIILEQKKKKYDIGYCTVVVQYPNNHMSGRAPTVKIFNDNARSSNPHPYVNSDGNPCYGGHSVAYGKIMASGDIEALSSFLYGFLTRSQGSGFRDPKDWEEIT